MQTGAHAHETILVPGSISNLGPGFDALSVAVGLYLRVTILEVLPSAPGILEMDFGSSTPPGENRILTGFRRAREHFGDPAPGLRLEVQSDIPMRAGLGSSAAATVAGLKLYETLTSPRAHDDLMVIATAIEGHPDNAAAALLGGLTLSCQQSDGRIITCAWRWPDDLHFVVATPGAELETAFARTVVPRLIPLENAVFNLQRALLLVRALETGQYEHLREALRDRWHQPARAAYVPGLADALALDHPSILGACLSGAGPSIALLVMGREDEASTLLGDIYTRLGLPYTIRTLSPHPPVVSSGHDS
ncbi:MAG: homoserine kinase [Vicinamibacterales bacterium]